MTGPWNEPGRPEPLAPRPRIRRVRLPYTGPPRYGRTHPNWGFPPIARRRAIPESEPQLEPKGLVAAAVMVGVAGVAVLAAAGAESWRYALLLRGRTEVLGSAVVQASDRTVLVAGVIAAILAVVAVAVCAAVVVRYYRAAAQRAGQRPARSAGDVVARLLVPVWNLYAAGPIVIDALRLAHSGSSPPRGSVARRLVVTWWCAWICNGLLALATIGMGLARLRWSGTQLAADTVEMHIVLDVSAALVAGLTVAVLLSLRRAWIGPREKDFAGWIVEPPRTRPDLPDGVPGGRPARAER